MKPTEAFKTTIQTYLDNRAETDSLFSASYGKEGKNIDDCCTYILNQVKESGCAGFADAEIFGMAVHYYDEDDIEIGKPVSGRVVVNHAVELTDAEIQEARKAAKERIISEEMIKMRKTAEPRKPEKKATETQPVQTSMF